MISKTFKTLTLLAGLLSTSMVKAIDCSIIYDEFDSLMHKDYLTSPEKYVSTIQGELDFEGFGAKQRGVLLLRKDRPDKGVGIVFTNNKLYGKFVFDWSDHQQLVFEDIIIYNRVEDGYAPFHLGPVSLKQGELIDLDSATVYLNQDEEDAIRADLALSPADNPVIKAINETEIDFPTTSLCD